MSAVAPCPGVDLTLDELITLAGAGSRLGSSRRRARRSDAVAAGAHSSHRSRGMEFAGLRGYQQGDDVRHMAWRATARTGRPQVREFHAETDRSLLLGVDLGASMRFGTRTAFKSVAAARAAAMLGWDAVSRGDRVGGMVVNGSQLREYRPAPRKAGLLPLLRAMVELHATPASQGGLSATLARLERQLPRGGRLVILSDFLELDGPFEQRLARLARRGELVLLRVCDPLEVEPPSTGRITLGDDAGELVVDGGDGGQRAAWVAAWRALDRRLGAVVGAHGGFARLRCDEDPSPLLAELLSRIDGPGAMARG